jgi:hypothetical protein
MTLHEQRRRAAALRRNIKAARESLRDALAQPDYEVAVAYQREIDEIGRELRALERPMSRGHELYPCARRSRSASNGG